MVGDSFDSVRKVWRCGGYEVERTRGSEGTRVDRESPRPTTINVTRFPSRDQTPLRDASPRPHFPQSLLVLVLAYPICQRPIIRAKVTLSHAVYLLIRYPRRIPNRRAATTRGGTLHDRDPGQRGHDRTRPNLQEDRYQTRVRSENESGAPKIDNTTTSYTILCQEVWRKYDTSSPQVSALV